jgi:hypothetical protein
MNMRKLKLDLSELIEAFDSGMAEASYYLDRDTGEVVLVTDETRGELNALYRQIGDIEDQDGNRLAEALSTSSLPDWQVEPVRRAEIVERGFGTRFVEVPRADSREGYGDMQAFVETIRDQRLRERLSDALIGRGAFRRFKDVLLRFPEERERWFAFKDARTRERVLAWLDSQGIVPIKE